jgi:hypothetical protein
MKRLLIVVALLGALYFASEHSGGKAYRAIRAMHLRLDRSYAKRLAEVSRLEKTTRKIRSAEQHDRELARRCIADSDWIFSPVYKSFHVGLKRWTPLGSAQKDSELSTAFKRHQSKD